MQKIRKEFTTEARRQGERQIPTPVILSGAPQKSVRHKADRREVEGPQRCFVPPYGIKAFSRELPNASLGMQKVSGSFDSPLSRVAGLGLAQDDRRKCVWRCSARERQMRRRGVERQSLERRRFISVPLRKSAASLSASCSSSIIQVEIQQLPVQHEPDKAQAGQQHQKIPRLGPHPEVAVAPGTEASHYYQHRPQRSQYAQHLDQIDAEVEFFAEATGARKSEDHGNEKDKVESADQSDPQTAAALGYIQFQPLVVMHADDGSHRPEHKRQPHDDQAGNQQRNVERVVLEQRRALVDNRGKTGDQLYPAIVGVAESNEFLVVDSAAQERSDLAPFLGLAVEVLQHADPDVAICLWRHHQFLRHEQDPDKVPLRAPAAEQPPGP